MHCEWGSIRPELKPDPTTFRLIFFFLLLVPFSGAVFGVSCSFEVPFFLRYLSLCTNNHWEQNKRYWHTNHSPIIYSNAECLCVCVCEWMLDWYIYGFHPLASHTKISLVTNKHKMNTASATQLSDPFPPICHCFAY